MLLVSQWWVFGSRLHYKQSLVGRTALDLGDGIGWLVVLDGEIVHACAELGNDGKTTLRSRHWLYIEK